MKQNQFIKEYTFSDLFDGTFKMLKYTWKNSIVVSSLAFMPVSFITVLMLQEYFKQLGALAKISMDTGSLRNGLDFLSSLLPMAGIFLVLLAVITVIDIFAHAIITVNTFKALREEPLHLTGIVVFVFKEKLGKLVLQTLLLTGIILGIYIGGAVVIGILSGLLSMVNAAFSMFILIVGILALIIFLIWLMLSFNFIMEELLFTDVPVTETFKKSLMLVKGNWWRVFGISLVFSLALSFGISIFTSPITFSFMAPYTSKMMDSLMRRGTDTEFYREIIDLYAQAKFPLFLSSYITSILTMLFKPVFNALFFIDLKFRKKQLDIDPEVPMSADEATTDYMTSGEASDSDSINKKDENNDA